MYCYGIFVSFLFLSIYACYFLCSLTKEYYLAPTEAVVTLRAQCACIVLTVIRVVITGMITYNHKKRMAKMKGACAMTNNLCEITKASQKGYIEDYGSIERIMSRLIRLPAAELDPKGDHCLLQNIGIFLEELGMNGIDKNDVCYGEFLGIMDDFAQSPDPDDPEIRLKIVMRSLINLVFAFRQNRGNNVAVKLFMAVTVKGYLDYLSQRAGARGVGIHNMYRRFRIDFRRAAGYIIDESTTIETFLGEIMRQLYIWWDISTPIEDYQKRIIGCHDALYSFFIDNFKTGIEEFFNIVQNVEPDTDDDNDSSDIF